MSSKPHVSPSVVPDDQPAATLDHSAAIFGSEEGAVGGISASKEASSSSSSGVPAAASDITNKNARKVITLFGGFSSESRLTLTLTFCRRISLI